jgi:hypothetical protein
MAPPVKSMLNRNGAPYCTVEIIMAIKPGMMMMADKEKYR